MPGPKKSKRDAKEGGGVVAAVTKHAAKFSNGNAQGFGSDTSSSSVQSPEIKPIATPSSNGNPTASPLLDAISANNNFNLSTSPGMSDWSKGTPALSGSPGNLISLMGESPPSRWASPRPYVNGIPASVSPPTAAGRRPLSYQMDTHYQPPELPSHIASPALRRSSLHSHIAQSRATPNPPLPHQPQAHFYGVPDIDFDLQPQAGMKAGQKGYHFAFDTLPSPYVGNGPGTDTVVTAGYEGGLEVYSVSKRGLERLASLKGLRGGIRQAEILPWTVASGAGAELFPLIAVVVHGPVLPPPAPEINIQADYDTAVVDRNGGSPSSSPPPPQADMAAREGLTAKGPLPVEFYQTSVEVYSLRTNKLVAVLLEAPKIPLKVSITSPIFQAPPPSGAFRLKADSGNIVVSSGITGECWVYRQMVAAEEPTLQFRCVGKLWTALQQPPKGDTAQEAVDRARAPVPRQGPRTPIVTLNGRWIAYCPAAPSSQIALRATVPVATYNKAPGFSSLTPPQPPSVTSEVDLPNESVVNKIMRDATQEIISGAKWVGHQGWQALNAYWKGSSATPQPSRSPPMGAQPWAGGYGQRQEAAQFPPTHGAVAPSLSKEPGLVSVVDIEALGNSSTIHPVTTFSTPLGCSFLSFSPSGTSLFTASTKGDVQTVWDLMRIQYTKASPLQSGTTPGAPTGPKVRQIAQFSRMTVARIMDVAWSKPNGERLAMVTERGTVHLLDMPSSAFTWPPPRRRTRPQDTKAVAAEGPSSAVSYASSAFNTALDAARPLLTRPRRSSSNVPQSAGASIVDHASHGGKMIAAGISHSLGKTGNAINQLRHTGENRVSLPPSSVSPGPGCVIWLSGRRYPSLFVLGEGLVRTFPSKSRMMTSGQRTVHLSRYRDFNLPGLSDDTIAVAVKHFLDPEEYLDLTDAGSNNTMILDGRPRLSQQDLPVESSIPQAEIESSAPYQPFHTDRRVGLFEFDPNRQIVAAALTATAVLPSVSVLLADTTLNDRSSSPGPRRKQGKAKENDATSEKVELAGGGGAWVFGEPISAVQLDTGYPRMSEESSFNMSTLDTRALPPSAMERVLQHVGEHDEQIVVTTRRRRGGGRVSDQDDDGFFEDDCEVLDFADQRV